MTTKITGSFIEGATTYGLTLLSAVDAAAARTALGVSTAAPQPAGHIYGLELSNNVSDATNDINIAAGICRDSADAVNITLASAITKRLDAAWAVGSGNGGRDTGSIADGWWHVHAIYRADTGVSDVLFSLSATSPTLPTNYTHFRRIGAVKRVSSSLLAFRQTGDVFKLETAVTDQTGTVAVADGLLTLSVPAGVRVTPILAADVSLTGAGAGSAIILLSDGDAASAETSIARVALAGDFSLNVVEAFVTNLSGQLRRAILNSSGTISLARIQTLGWIDRRGR